MHTKMKYLYIIASVALALSLPSCKKFDDFQENPNNPTVADPALLLPRIEQQAFNNISADAALASRYLVYTQGASNAQYYGWQRGSMIYSNISQVIKMEQEAARIGKPNYRYIGKFLKAHFILEMTQRLGDIPYSKMMQSMVNSTFDSASTRPVYDNQETIYKGVLDELKLASDSLTASALALNGDLVYSGSVSQWKKLINAYTLRVLMSLSMKEGIASLNIKQRFNEIVSNPTKYPLLISNADNGKLQYYNITGNQYHYYNSNSMKTDYYLDSSFVKVLKDLKDPRLFVYGLPATATGLPEGNFDAYDGLVGSQALAYNTAKRGQGKASQINKRYAYEPINEPSILMSYSEQQFILAEAVVRGWITGNADSYYKQGIEAALVFSNFNNTYASSAIVNYLAQPSITLQPATAIQQIITQKYISQFMNAGWQAFFEQRRTGFPAFETVGAGVLNGGKIPKRWMYPTEEFNNNRVNVENAVKTQFPAGDDINGVMWILK
jgi:hypothetical protein